jgi:hypothetical protein
VEILTGLTEGERVIVGNLGKYQTGQIVRPTASLFTPGQNGEATE